MKSSLFSALFALLLFAWPSFSSAQFLVPGTGPDLTLTATPDHPLPGESVQLSVRSVLIDLSASNITWYANGKVIAEGMGTSGVTVTVGSLGSETRVRAEVQTDDGLNSVSGVLRPTEIDLLWEGESYTPPFYEGRSLPSAGSGVRVLALPRFLRPGSTTYVPPNELRYTWSKNGKTIAGVSGLGKQTAVLESPNLFGTDTIQVSVSTEDGLLQGTASVRMVSVEPELVLYQHHPLFGVLYHRALETEARVPEVEATLAVIPYFAPARSLEGGLSYAWRVNSSSVAADSVRPNSITINAAGSSGRALIEVALTHATNFFVSASKRWGVTFAAPENSAFSNPFGATE